MNTSTSPSSTGAPANGSKTPKQPMSPADAAIASATMFSELGHWLVQVAGDYPQLAGAGRVGRQLIAGADAINPPPEPKPAEEPPAEPQPDHSPATPPPAEHPVTPPDTATRASGSAAPARH